MTTNPYESPQAEQERITIRHPIRISFGGICFVILGLILFASGVAMAIGAVQENRLPRSGLTFMALTAIWLTVLGLSLTLHGILRREATINAVVILMLSFAAVVIVTVLVAKGIV